MKKLILPLLCFLSIAGYAQEENFILTPEGFISDNADHPDYILVEFPGVNQRELFDAVQAAIGKTFVSPKDVISKVEPQQITVNGVLSNSVWRTNSHKFDLNFTIVFQVRDGRIRINTPAVNSITTYTHKHQEMFVQKPVISIGGDEFSIFNPKGEVRIEKAKETLELNINLAIQAILSEINEIINDEW